MYIRRIEELKTKMASRPLSEREVLPYLVVSMVLCAGASYITQRELTFWDYLEAAWSIALAAAGTIYIYRKNAGSNGCHFLQRYFAIGWVVSVRWFVFLLPAGIAWYAALEIFGIPTEHTGWHLFLFAAAAETIVFLMIGHHVRDLAQREMDNNEQIPD
jgi:hypothetical protein